MSAIHKPIDMLLNRPLCVDSRRLEALKVDRLKAFSAGVVVAALWAVDLSPPEAEFLNF